MASRGLLHDGLAVSADSYPSKPAIVTEHGSATFLQLLVRSRSLAGALQEEGLQRGDRVVLFMENSLACATAVMGVLQGGGVFVVVNPQTKVDRLTFILDDCGAKFLLTEGPISRIAANAGAAAARPPQLVCARPPDDVAGNADLDRMVSAGKEPLPGSGIPTDLAALIYTSGSTGTPKGVMHTHQGLVFVIESIAKYLRLGPEDRILNVLSLAFGYGLSQLLLATRLGATLLLEPSFAYPARTLQRIEAEEATVLPAIPTVFATLASRFGNVGKIYPTVRTITNAAAGLPPSLHRPLRAFFPNASIFRMYGLTECIRVCYLEPELLDRKPTSVGKAIPGTAAFVLDDQGRPVPPGEVGTLHVRGPHVMPAYWKDEELTAHMIREGAHPGERVLCTHDLFTIDSEGDLYFVSRSDEIIKTRGEKVSPVHVENVLCSVEGVKEAAVVGVPDELLGEAIRAFVVRDDGIAVTESELIRACRRDLEAFAVPHEVRFIEELPKTPSGKVRRRSLLP